MMQEICPGGFIKFIETQDREFSRYAYVVDDEFVDVHRGAESVVKYVHGMLTGLLREPGVWNDSFRGSLQAELTYYLSGQNLASTALFDFYNQETEEREARTVRKNAFIREVLGLDEEIAVMDEHGNILPQVVIPVREKSYLIKQILIESIRDFPNLSEAVFEDIIDIALATYDDEVHRALVNAIIRGHDPYRNPEQKKRVSYMVDRMIDFYSKRVSQGDRSIPVSDSIHRLRKDIMALLNAVRAERDSAIPLDVETKAKLLGFALVSGDTALERGAITVFDKLDRMGVQNELFDIPVQYRKGDLLIRTMLSSLLYVTGRTNVDVVVSFANHHLANFQNFVISRLGSKGNDLQPNHISVVEALRSAIIFDQVEKLIQKVMDIDDEVLSGTLEGIDIKRTFRLQDFVGKLYDFLYPALQKFAPEAKDRKLLESLVGYLVGIYTSGQVRG